MFLRLLVFQLIEYSSQSDQDKGKPRYGGSIQRNKLSVAKDNLCASAYLFHYKTSF